MVTLKRAVFNLVILSLLSACAPLTPLPNLLLDVNTKRLPGTVLLRSNLEDNYYFYRTVEINQRTGPYRVSGTQTHVTNIGQPSHNLFRAGLTYLFDNVLTVGQEPAGQDYDYQLIPSLAYNETSRQKKLCGARVRYGALLRHRDGRIMEFDSGWAEVNRPKAFLSDVDMYCYWAAFARAEEQAFHSLAQKISTSQFTAASTDNQNPASGMTSAEWAMEHADTKIKLARLIDGFRKEVFPTQTKTKIILGPFVSTDNQVNQNFATYIRGEIFKRLSVGKGFNITDRVLSWPIVDPSNLYWTLNQYAIPFHDLHSTSTTSTIATDTGAGSILFGTLTTEEPWIKVKLSLRDLTSDTEITSSETKLFKSVAVRAYLERGEIPPDCLACRNPHFTPP